MVQMLGCIIVDFCHCPASSCLGHQQTHPRVREDSSCFFHTTPSCRQRGEGGWELQPAASKHYRSSQHHSELGSGGSKQERPHRQLFYLSSLTAPFCRSHISGSLPVPPTGKKICPVIFNRRRLRQLSVLKVFLHTNNGTADLFIFF